MIPPPIHLFAMSVTVKDALSSPLTGQAVYKIGKVVKQTAVLSRF